MIYYTYLILLFLFNLPWRSGRWIYLLPASSRSQKYFHQQLNRSGSKLEHIFKSRCNRIRAPALFVISNPGLPGENSSSNSALRQGLGVRLACRRHGFNFHLPSPS